MSQCSGLKGTIPQYQQYSLPPRNQQVTFSTSDRYGGSFLASQQKSKGGLSCKKDKKHQTFDLIFICLEKECANNFKPICAQCLHEEHSGHEIKLIKEIAEISNSFIEQERKKKKISPYWEQLSDQYNSLYEQIESIISHLQTFQSTLKKQNDQFYSKLNSEKDQFWETVEAASQRILQEKYTSEEDLFQKIRLILKNVKIDDPANPAYRYNILKEETVLLVMQNYKEIDVLVSQAKEFVFQTLNEDQIKESYQAQEFKITDGEDYLKISKVESKVNNSGNQSSCIVEFDEEKDDDNINDCELENFDNEDDIDDIDDIDGSNSFPSKMNRFSKQAGDKKEKRHSKENCLNESDDFDLIEDENQKQKKQEIQDESQFIKQAKEGRQTTHIQTKVSQLLKINQNRLPEKPSSQEIRMKYAADFSNQFRNSQQPPVIQSHNQNLRKKENTLSSHFDDIQSSNIDYQYSSSFVNRLPPLNSDDSYKHHETSYQTTNTGSSLNQLCGLSRQSRQVPPPNNIQIQSYVNQYQKM